MFVTMFSSTFPGGEFKIPMRRVRVSLREELSETYFAISMIVLPMLFWRSRTCRLLSRQNVLVSRAQYLWSFEFRVR